MVEVGGGWYGGLGECSYDSGGGGGSGHLGNISNGAMVAYNDFNTSLMSSTTTAANLIKNQKNQNDGKNNTTLTRNVSTTPTSSYAKKGDGAAKITPVN